MTSVRVGSITIANHRPFVLIGGVNVLESPALALEVASHFVEVSKKLDIPYIFKGSFDKANRSSIHSYRGPGLEAGLRILAQVRERFSVPVLTDVHERHQVSAVAKVCDMIQLPAFLARQTDLIAEIARVRVPVHIKKPQFLAPSQMQFVVQKFHQYKQKELLVCERGSCFGYDNLVVDMLGLSTLKKSAPTTFDVTHALQFRPNGAEASGGRRAQLVELARAAMAVGLAGLFVEAHPDPDQALCDGPSALRLSALETLLTQIKAIDTLVKGFAKVSTH